MAWRFNCSLVAFSFGLFSFNTALCQKDKTFPIMAHSQNDSLVYVLSVYCPLLNLFCQRIVFFDLANKVILNVTLIRCEAQSQCHPISIHETFLIPCSADSIFPSKCCLFCNLLPIIHCLFWCTFYLSCLFGPNELLHQPKFMSFNCFFTARIDKEKQQNLTFKLLEPTNG